MTTLTLSRIGTRRAPARPARTAAQVLALPVLLTSLLLCVLGYLALAVALVLAVRPLV